MVDVWFDGRRVNEGCWIWTHYPPRALMLPCKGMLLPCDVVIVLFVAGCCHNPIVDEVGGGCLQRPLPAASVVSWSSLLLWNVWLQALVRIGNRCISTWIAAVGCLFAGFCTWNRRLLCPCPLCCHEYFVYGLLNGSVLIFADPLNFDIRGWFHWNNYLSMLVRYKEEA